MNEQRVKLTKIPSGGFEDYHHIPLGTVGTIVNSGDDQVRVYVPRYDVHVFLDRNCFEYTDDPVVITRTHPDPGWDW